MKRLLSIIALFSILFDIWIGGVEMACSDNTTLIQVCHSTVRHQGSWLIFNIKI